MAKTIVILGAGFVGVSLTHKLLKNSVPKIPDLKVILVTPNTHFYWNPAAVRAVVPDEIAEETIFTPLEPGFAKYPSKNFEFVLGTATAVDPASNSVTVSLSKTAGSEKKLHYDHLVLATGSNLAAPNLPFKTLGTTEATKSRIHELQREIEDARSIVIAGGGPTGVETAGELGEKYGKTKKITLVVASDRPLDTLQPKTSSIAVSTLQKMGVEVVTGAKVISHSGGQATLSTGSAIPADMYLPLFGVKANTSFLPPSMLTASGDVKQAADLHVEGYANIWAAGDVGNLESKQIVMADPQATHLAKNLHAVLTGGEAKPYALSKPMLGLSIGKKSGTGEMNGWRLFGFLITMLKSKTLMAERMGPLVAGS